MKLSNLITSTLCIALGVKANNGINEFLNSLNSVIEGSEEFPLNLSYAVVGNMNDTIKSYEDLFNASKDECLRGAYSYSLHMLEISYNLNCTSKYNTINEEYKKNKPCYKVNQDLQNILDNGNAYLDLFCGKDENSKPCSYVSNIANLPTNTTLLKDVCASPKTNRTQCENNLIQNLSVMIDSAHKIKSNNGTYASGGNSITLTTPKFDLTQIEATMKNNTCIVDIQPPKQVLVSSEPPKKKNDNKKDESSDALVQNMSSFFTLATIAIVALLF